MSVSFDKKAGVLRLVGGVLEGAGELVIDGASALGRAAVGGVRRLRQAMHNPAKDALKARLAELKLKMQLESKGRIALERERARLAERAANGGVLKRVGRLLLAAGSKGVGALSKAREKRKALAEASSNIPTYYL